MCASRGTFSLTKTQWFTSKSIKSRFAQWFPDWNDQTYFGSCSAYWGFAYSDVSIKEYSFILKIIRSSSAPQDLAVTVKSVSVADALSWITCLVLRMLHGWTTLRYCRLNGGLTDSPTYWYLPRRGYCVEQSTKSCSCVHTYIHPYIHPSVTKSARIADWDNFCVHSATNAEVWGSQNWPIPVQAGKWARFDGFWIIRDWRMLVTSGLLYAIVPEGPPMPCGCYLVFKTCGAVLCSMTMSPRYAFRLISNLIDTTRTETWEIHSRYPAQGSVPTH